MGLPNEFNKFNEKAIKKLIFWKNNINFFNNKPLRACDLPTTVVFEQFLRMCQGHIPVIKN